MLGCQVWLMSSLCEGSMWAAGRSLPEMSLAFALMAAINGSTGSCATLSHTGSNNRTKPRRRQPGGPVHSHPSGVAAQRAARDAVGKRFGGVDIANGDDELGPAIALRRHAEGLRRPAHWRFPPRQRTRRDLPDSLRRKQQRRGTITSWRIWRV